MKSPATKKSLHIHNNHIQSSSAAMYIRGLDKLLHKIIKKWRLIHSKWATDKTHFASSGTVWHWKVSTETLSKFLKYCFQLKFYTAQI